MLYTTEHDRHEVATRLQGSPVGQLDPAAPLLVEAGYCPMCSETALAFRDELSLREYGLSGLCQKCQDSTFGAEGETMETPVDPTQLVELQEVREL